MIEFTISFKYRNREQRARLLRSGKENITEYLIRPIDPLIVKSFGNQITIFKKDGHYNCLNHIKKDYKDFFHSLINAIRSQDKDIFQIA